MIGSRAPFREAVLPLLLLGVAGCNRSQPEETRPTQSTLPSKAAPAAPAAAKPPQPSEKPSESAVPSCVPRFKKLVFSEFNDKPTQDSYPEQTEYTLEAVKAGAWFCVPGPAALGISGYPGRAETIVVDTALDAQGRITLTVDHVEGSTLSTELAKGAAFGWVERSAKGRPALVFGGELRSTYRKKSLLCQEPSDDDPDRCSFEW